MPMTSAQRARYGEILREEIRKSAIENARLVQIDIEMISAAFDAAIDEAPRATSVVIAAFVDDELTRYFERMLIGPEKVVANLFGPQAPLGSLNNKIDVAYCLGWIARDMFEDLHLIRRIRNAFAHNPRVTSFEQEPVLSHLRKMEFDDAILEDMGWPSLRARIQNDTRFEYLVKCAFRLHTFLRNVAIGPVLIQQVDGTRIYNPKISEMPPTERTIVDWWFQFNSQLEEHSRTSI